MYLNTHSFYSLRYGTIAPETLLQQAQQLAAGGELDLELLGEPEPVRVPIFMTDTSAD